MVRKHSLIKLFSKFFSCIPKRTSPKLNVENQKHEKCLGKVCEINNCENNDCLDCLLEELKKENWKASSENIFLKIAYEKNIILDIATSINQLDKEDKKYLGRILVLYDLKHNYRL